MAWGEATKSKTQKRETSQGRTTQRNKTNPTKQKTGHAKRTNQDHTEGGATSTSQDKGPQGGQTKPNKTRARGEGDKRRPSRKERADAREGSRTGGRKQHKPRRQARAALAVSEGYSGSHEGEYLSDGARGTWTKPTTWCRGQSPTQGRSLCCQEAERRQEPINHDTPYQR